PQESDHRRAQGFYRSISEDTRLLTSNYVVAETITWLRYHLHHRAALDFQAVVDRAIERRTLRIAWVDEGVHQAGWEIFARYHDQTLSMTDCTSAVVAREARADYVFGFDSDFSILGFDVRPGQ
ncbi:MAG: type II toxin-antitoxin system VapC family toxin, partial [Tepidiformaceae bacterium]